MAEKKNPQLERRLYTAIGKRKLVQEEKEQATQLDKQISDMLIELANLMNCPNQGKCFGHGQCIFDFPNCPDILSSIVFEDYVVQLEQILRCEGHCECEPNWRGEACAVDIESWDSRVQQRSQLVEHTSLITGQLVSSSQVTQRITDILDKLTTSPQELSDAAKIQSLLMIGNSLQNGYNEKQQITQEVTDASFKTLVNLIRGNIIQQSFASDWDALLLGLDFDTNNPTTQSMLYSSLDVLSRLILKDRVPGEDIMQLMSSELNMVNIRESSGVLAGANISSFYPLINAMSRLNSSNGLNREARVNAGFSLPNSIFENTKASTPTDTVDAQFIQFQFNPFNDSSTSIGTDVFLLELHDENSVPIKVKDLQEPIIIELPITDTKDASMVRFALEGIGKYPDSFQVLHNGTLRIKLHTEAKPEQCPKYHADSAKSEDLISFSWNCSVLEIEASTTLHHHICNGSEYEVVPQCENLDLYGFCVYWEEQEGKWSSEGCTFSHFSVRESGTEPLIVCGCTHLSSFGGAISQVAIEAVAVYNHGAKIDIDTLWTMANPIMRAMLVGIHSAYVITLLWGVWRDRREFKRGVDVVQRKHNKKWALRLVAMRQYVQTVYDKDSKDNTEEHKEGDINEDVGVEGDESRKHAKHLSLDSSYLVGLGSLSHYDISDEKRMALFSRYLDALKEDHRWLSVVIKTDQNYTRPQRLTVLLCLIMGNIALNTLVQVALGDNLTTQLRLGMAVLCSLFMMPISAILSNLFSRSLSKNFAASASRTEKKMHEYLQEIDHEYPISQQLQEEGVPRCGWRYYKAKKRIFAERRHHAFLATLPVNLRRLYLIDDAQMQDFGSIRKKLYKVFLGVAPPEVYSYFSWWASYIVYALALSFIFFTTWFVFSSVSKWGDSIIDLWIGAVIVSLLQGFFVNEPIKVLVKSILLPSLLIRHLGVKDVSIDVKDMEREFIKAKAHVRLTMRKSRRTAQGGLKSTTNPLTQSMDIELATSVAE